MRWQVTGADRNSGQERTAIVEAPTQAHAEHVANSQGLLIQSIVPAQPEAPFGAPPAASLERANGSGSKLPLIFSILALIIGAGAVVGAFIRGPGIPGRGLSAYDFSTPEKASRSQIQMRARNDIQARIEFQEKVGREEREKAIAELETFKFEKDLDAGGDKHAVLYTITSTDKDKKTHVHHITAWVKKNKDGFFEPSDSDTSKLSEENRKAVQEWQSKDFTGSSR